MNLRVALAAVLFSSFTVACAGQSREPATPGAQDDKKAPPVTTTPGIIVSPNDAGTPNELFEKGKTLLLQEKYKEAADLFDTVERGEPEGKLAPLALIHAGLAYEGMGDKAQALARYEKLRQKHPKDDLVKVALVRKSRVLVSLEKWQDVVANANAMLERADLTVAEAIEAQGAKGLGLTESGDPDQGLRAVEKARDLMEKHHIGEVGRVPQEVSQVFYALGEARKAKSETIKFDPPPPNFGEVFEQRAQGLLDAQAAYTDAMRTTEPIWATMAGFRVGEMYKNLHKDVMVMRMPLTGAKTEKDKQLFEGAVRLRYRVLLEKGLKMMDATIRMNERVGEESAWTAKARAAKGELEKDIAEQNAFLKKLPVSEEDLRKLLDDLAKKRADDKDKKK